MSYGSIDRFRIYMETPRIGNGSIAGGLLTHMTHGNQCRIEAASGDPTALHLEEENQGAFQFEVFQVQ